MCLRTLKILVRGWIDVVADMGGDTRGEFDFWFSVFHWILPLFLLHIRQKLKEHEDWDDCPSSHHPSADWEWLQDWFLCSKQVAILIHSSSHVFYNSCWIGTKRNSGNFHPSWIIYKKHHCFICWICHSATKDLGMPFRFNCTFLIELFLLCSIFFIMQVQVCKWSAPTKWSKGQVLWAKGCCHCSYWSFWRIPYCQWLWG